MYYLGAAVALYPFKFSLLEVVSYLGERGVLCVGNGGHFCTPVLMNMCNITFEVSRSSTFVFKKYSEKNIPSRLNNSDKSLKGFD